MNNVQMLYQVTKSKVLSETVYVVKQGFDRVCSRDRVGLLPRKAYLRGSLGTASPGHSCPKCPRGRLSPSS